MDNRTSSARAEPIPSILKKPKSRRTTDFLDRSTKIKREKVDEQPKNGDVSTTLPQGCTPLMYACQQADYKSVVDILNKDPASVRVRDRGSRCALHYCASSGAGVNQSARAACADRILMAAPALADARDADGLTPLHLAVVHGNVPLVQTLLAAGADVNARDDEQHTVVHWATVCGEVGALRAVLAAGADAATPDQHGGYPLHYAAQMCGAPAATDHQSRGAALEVVRALVKEGGARVGVRDADGRTPLLWAASAGSAAAVLALHQAGAKVDDADRDGLTALHCAAARGHTEALETLVGLCGARADAADSHGCTPLHYAAALGHADATAALLAHGADAHRQDRRGRSPAHTAAAKGQIETMRILGAQGANLWLRNSKGDLPLHESVGSGRRELVKWLLDGRPSQVNATNHEGRTPLHVAAATDNADLCRLLLDRGAEINPVARSSKNEPITPLDCATSRGHRSTAKYLQMHGGLPASKLSNTQIVIDGAPITALPTRKVTSTKIDVRDRIRIEKREVVELSSPIPERRYLKDESVSSESSSDNNKRSRKGKKNTDKHDRKRKTVKSQKSFSDGYDSDHETATKRKSSKDRKNHKKPSKKGSRSRSEPSRRKVKQRYESESDSSSQSSYTEKRKSKRHHKRGRRKSSSSDSSSSESSERRSTKREGKRTSIHIEHDDRKQSVNIVKYKTDAVDKTERHDENRSQLEESATLKSSVDDKETQLAKSKTHSETETDTVSVKTNMVITEAQIHMERESSQHGSSELTVTMDSMNNVSIESNNMAVTHKDITGEDKDDKNIDIKETENKKDEGIPIDEAIKDENNTALESPVMNQREDNDEELKLSQEKSDVSQSQLKTGIENSEIKKDITALQEETATKDTVTASQEENATKDNNIAVQEENATKDTGSTVLNKETITIIGAEDGAKVEELSISPSLEQTRKRSFQVLSGPEDTLDTKENKEKPVSSAVSFANTTEIIESSTADSVTDHLMGEKIDHLQTSTDRLIKSSSDANFISPDEKRKDYASTTASSSELVQSVDKGLVTVIGDDTLNETAVQQAVINNSSEEMETNLQSTQCSPKQIRKTSKDSVSSRKSSIYETESYKVLSDIASAAEGTTGILKKTSTLKTNEGDSREVFEDERETKDYLGRVPSVSDNEIYSHSEANGRRKRFTKKSRAKSRTVFRSKSENSERGYESSGMMDSGFEPSPRAIQKRILSPRLAAYYKQRNASGRFSGKSDSRIPVRKPGDKNAVDMKSVTQRIQTNMRRYYCERKIFQHLLELKRLQIRTSKTNEAVLVKRTIDEYNKSSLATVGLGPYNNPDFTFSSFEKFLYESLRKLQKSGKRHLDNLPMKPIDFDYGESELYKMGGIPDNPCLCTSKTHRCFHAVHAYTGIPCSAYIPYKMDHHTMPKPTTASKSKGFLPKINSKPPSGNSKAHVTLEVSHGTERQLIALPAEKLDKNKRYYVTFTVKGSEPPSDNDNSSPKVPSRLKNTRSIE